MDAFSVFNLCLYIFICLWLIFISNCVSSLVVFVLNFIFYGKETSYESGGLSSTFVSILQMLTSYIFTSITSLIQTIWIIFPLVVFIFIMDLVYSNYSTGLTAIIQGYNDYFVKTDLFLNTRYLVSYGRLVFEVFVPIFNLVVDTALSIPMSSLKIIFGDDAMENNMAAQNLILGMANFIESLITGLGWWLYREINTCSPSTVLLEIEKNGLREHGCLDVLARSVDLRPQNGDLARVASGIITLSNKLCPTAGSVLSLLMVPLFNPEMVVLIQEIINFVLALTVTTWQVTALRCAVVLQIPSGGSSALCSPDMSGVFTFAKRVLASLGVVMDDWTEMAYAFVLSLFLERESMLNSDCGVVNVVQSSGIKNIQSIGMANLIRMSDSAVAIVRRSEAVFLTTKGNSTQALKNVEFDTRYGNAPILYGLNYEEQSVFGCSCVDGEVGGGDPLIRCPVLSRETGGDGDGDGSESTDTIPIFFSDTTQEARQNVKCSDLMITIQPLSVKKWTTSAQRDRPISSKTNCFLDPESCSDIDVVVYVTLACGNTGEANCFARSKRNLCYPYCIGFHQVGAGPRPIYVTNADVYKNGGRLLLNMQCVLTDPVSNPDESLISQEIFVQSGDGYSSEFSQRVEMDFSRLCTPTVFASTRVGVESVVNVENIEFSREQPFIYAGSYIVTEELHATGLDDITDRRVKIDQIAFTESNSVVVVPVISGVPLEATFIPSQNRAYSMVADLAASTHDGVLFYAINAPLSNIMTYLQGQSGFDFDSTTETRLIRFAAQGSCASRNGRVEYCDDKLVKTIPGFPENPFPSSEVAFLEAKDQRARTFDLYISSVVLYDKNNILVSVRHGPILGLSLDFGILTNEEAIPESFMSTRYYFIDTNMTQLRFRMGQPYGVEALEASNLFLCPEDRRVPPIFSVFVAGLQVQLTVTGIIINDYFLNGIGILQNMLSDRTECQGRSWQHMAYDGCSALRPRPLSMYPVVVALTDLDFKTRIVAERTTSLLSDIFVSEDRSSRNFLRAMGFSMTTEYSNIEMIADGIGELVTSDSVMTIFELAFRNWAVLMAMWPLMFDLYVLPIGEFFIKSLVKGEFSNARLWNNAMKVHYDAAYGELLERNVFIPFERTCFIMAHFSWDNSNPIGKFLQRGCQSIVESTRILLKTSAYVFSVPQVNLCLCSSVINFRYSHDVGISPALRELQSTCPDAVPNILLNEYLALLIEKDTGVCQRVVSRTRSTLFNMPDRLVRIMTLFWDSIADVTAFVPSLTGIVGIDFTACSRPDRTIDGGTLLPQPLVSFMGCGMTPRCRLKCSSEIGWFESMQETTDSFSSEVTQSRNDTYLLAFKPRDSFYQPLLVQAYVQSYEEDKQGECMYHYVALTRTTTTVSGGFSDWNLRSYCMSTTGVRLLDMESIATLENTRDWRIDYDSPKRKFPRDIRVEMMSLLPRVFDDNSIRRFMGGLVVQTYDPILFMSELHLFTVSTIGVRVTHTVLFNSKDILFQPGSYIFNSVQEILEESCDPLPDGEHWDMNILEISSLGESSDAHFSLPYVFSVPDSSSDISLFYSTNYRWIATQGSVSCVAAAHLFVKIYMQGQLPEFILKGDRKNFMNGKLDNSNTMLMSTNAPRLNKWRGVIFAVSKGEWCPFKIEVVERISNISVTEMECYRQINAGSSYALYSSSKEVISKTMILSTDSTGWHAIKTDRGKTSHQDYWARVIKIDFDETADLKVVVRAIVGVPVSMEIKHSQACTYMTCNSCSNIQTRTLCQSAQDCVIRECIGTPVSAGNWFCTLGLLLREYKTESFEELLSGWHMFSEVLTVGIEVGTLKGRLPEIQIEAISNIVLNEMCQAKDVVAVLSTIIPTFFVTLSNSASGFSISDFSLNPSSRAYAALSRVVSPSLKLKEIQYVMATSQMLYQVLLGYVQYLYAGTRVVMCSARAFNTLSGGIFSIVDYDFNVEGDICSIMLPTLDFADEGLQARTDRLYKNVRATGSTATEVRDYKGNLLAGNGGSVVVDLVQTIFTTGFVAKKLSPASQKFDQKVSFWKDKYSKNKNSRVSAKRKAKLNAADEMLPDRKVVLFYMGAALDWIVGLLHGIAGLARIGQPECGVRPKSIVNVRDCACGDSSFYIPGEKQAGDLSSTIPPFWCSGILRMIDRDGAVVYIKNDFTYTELVRRFERKGDEYLECIAENGEEGPLCVALARQISGEIPEWGRVSPLAVVNRCRENYSLRRWDPGLFAALHPETREYVESIGDIRNTQLTEVEMAVRKLGPEVSACLAYGEVQNSIEACTALFFRTLAGSSAEVTFETSGRAQYFSYTQTSAVARSTPDACKFLSHDIAQWSDSDMSQRVQDCNSVGLDTLTSQQCENTQSSCSIPMTTVSITNGRKKNAIGLFVNDEIFTVTEQHYTDTSECAISKIDAFWTQNSERFTVESMGKYNFSFNSYEGDYWHNYFDCMIEGAYPSLPLIPGDPEGKLENITFQSPENSKTCVPPVLYNRYDDAKTPIPTRTCGSSARSGIATFLLQKLSDSALERVVQAIKKMFTEDIPGQIQGADFKREDEGCRIDGNCTPNVLFKTSIKVADVLRDTGVLENIRYMSSVSLFFMVGY